MSKQLIQSIGFTPKENSSGIFQKTYAGGYSIEIDFDNKKIDFGNLITCESKTSQNFSQSENWVVLECVNRLLEKGYAPKNITLEKVFPSGHGTSGRLDVLVTRDDGTAYLMIECKTYGAEFNKELKKIKENGGQLFTYFQQDTAAEILMLYASELNGNEIIYRNEIIKIEEDYRKAGNVKDFHDKWNKLTKDNGVWESPVYDFFPKSLTIDKLVDIRQEDSSFIFNQFLEILRHNVVSDKGNAFNRIFTLFLCKIYDEKVNEGTENELGFQWIEGEDHRTFQLRLTDLYKAGMFEFLEKSVTDFSETEFNNKFNYLTEVQRTPILREFQKIRLEKNNEFAIKDVYDEQSFNENAVVVKEVVQLLEKYKLRYTKKQQYLSDFFELLLTTGLKQESGQFFTPVPIAQFIIKSLPIDSILELKLVSAKKDELLPYVMDYAAGSGHFVTEMMHEMQHLLKQKDDKKYHPSVATKIRNWQDEHFAWAIQYIYGIEKDYRLVKVGKVGCYLHGDGLANVIHSDGLANFAHPDYKGKLLATDKEFPQDNKQFDIVVSNPPYSVSSFKNNAYKYYTKDDFETYDKLTDQSSEIECLFIERTKQLLKDGGIAGVILPSSILSNTGIYTKAREIILQYFDIIAIAELGSNTFMATGTNTVTLFLRRRDNYKSIRVRTSVERQVADAKDGAIEGVENAFSKYVAHVWEGISFADYATLLKKEPNDAIKNHEIYQEYQKKINAKDDAEKLNKIIEIETEKLFYFILAYKQKIVLVKSGEKQEEKNFLGYEFSNRRGSEGIHPIQRGKAIDECTQLFDADVFDNPEKASTYIYHAFNGDFETPINEKLSKHISRQNLVDMFTFDRVDFEKNISLAVKKKVKIESKWDLVRLGDVCDFEYGKPLPESNRISGKYPVLGSNGRVGFHNEFIVQSPAIIVGRKGSAGEVIWETENCFPIDTTFYIKLKTSDVLLKFIFLILKSIKLSELAGGAGVPGLNRNDAYQLKVPLPPKDIQEKIVAEIEILEVKEAEAKVEIEANKKLITNCFANLAFDEQNLGNIAAFKNGLNYSRSSVGELIKIIGVKDFQDNFSPDLNLLEETQIDGKLSDDYCLMPKDILVVRSNGSANLVGRFLFVDKLTDKTSFSGFTIRIRPINDNAVDSKFLCYFLRTDFVRNKIISESGGSNIKSLNQTLLSSIKVPLPPIADQQKIVSQITEIENKIAALESEISNIPQQKEAVLKKYL
jgi:type I restriction enzyme M protein